MYMEGPWSEAFNLNQRMGQRAVIYNVIQIVHAVMEITSSYHSCQVVTID